MTDKTLDQMASLLEAARREAYEAGFNDALKHIVSAASALPKGLGGAGRGTAGPAGGGARRGGGGPEAAPGPAVERGRRARRGLVEEQVTAALGQEARGMTIREIEAWSLASGSPVKQPSIRVALLRLEQAGRALRDGRRWRLRPPSWDEPAADDTGPAASEDADRDVPAPEQAPPSPPPD